MDSRPETIRLGARAARACVLAFAAAIAMTWPLASDIGGLGRTTSDDGRYAIWNVAWVAHILTTSPLDLFDANIFHPHKLALAFSELNIVAGMVGIPAWLLTKNPYAAHNTAALTAFATSAICAWLLGRRLSGSGAAAMFPAVAFAFGPYFFAHTAHIQLLFGAGIPLSLFLLHRLADVPTPARGVALGFALAAQALACAYYGILAGLMIGHAALFLAMSRGLWRNRAYWIGLAAGAGVSIAVVLPFFLPFLDVQESGFHRTLDESRRYSANLASYLASSAHAHRWVLGIAVKIGRWNEVLFPGMLAIALGAVGAVVAGWRPRPSTDGVTRDRETLWLYGSLLALIVWSSLGPAAGLYTVLFNTVPVFSFLRAPGRFGVVVPLILGLFGAIALARLPPRVRTAGGVLAALLACVELTLVPFPWDRAPVPPAPYAMLAQMPRGPVAEFPFYGGRVAYPLHTQYMLFSTTHWQPLLNGYSDHIPGDFRDAATALDSFPSDEAFAVLRRRRVRYITVHWDMYGSRQGEIRERLEPYRPYLRELAADERMVLFQVVGFP